MRGSASRRFGFRGWVVLTSVGMVGCEDPVRDRRVDALGPETPGVAKGPWHRPGQPCLACHDGEDHEVRAFSVGGTVFAFDDGGAPVSDVVVELTDTSGRTYRTATNCAGNFFVLPEDFSPSYPLWVTLVDGDRRVDMDSPVERDGSCGSCHTRTPGPRSTPPVYLYDLPRTLGPNTRGCP